MNKFLTGQDIMKNPSASANIGFNYRIRGHSYLDAFQYPYEKSDMERQAGWELADKMIDAGELFFVYNFHEMSCEKGHAFPYGGTWVCNTCNHDHLDAPWWKVRVFKDGSDWCCIGVDFENLQESDNFAFGETREAAINNYGKLMLQHNVEIIEWQPTPELRWYSSDERYFPVRLERRFACKASDGTNGYVWAEVPHENSVVRIIKGDRNGIDSRK